MRLVPAGEWSPGESLHRVPGEQGPLASCRFPKASVRKRRFSRIIGGRLALRHPSRISSQHSEDPQFRWQFRFDGLTAPSQRQSRQDLPKLARGWSWRRQESLRFREGRCGIDGIRRFAVAEVDPSVNHAAAAVATLATDAFSSPPGQDACRATAARPQKIDVRAASNRCRENRRRLRN